MSWHPAWAPHTSVLGWAAGACAGVAPARRRWHMCGPMAVLFLCLALAVSVFSSVCPLLPQGPCCGAACLRVGIRSGFPSSATPSCFLLRCLCQEALPSPVTVAVCAHVSGRRHPLELSPPPLSDPSTVRRLPAHGSRALGSQAGAAVQSPPRAQWARLSAVAAVWVVSEPAVPGWLDRSGSFLSQLRELLTGRTPFWANHCQAAAGMLGLLAGGLGLGQPVQTCLCAPSSCHFLLTGVWCLRPQLSFD